MEWGGRFPFLTIRDQVAAQAAFADALGIDRFAAVVGGSMGGMHALEWAIGLPERVERVAVLAAPPASTADQIALNSVQTEAVRSDPRFRGGDYYDAADGEGPHRGLALARRMALLNYRSAGELNERFGRSWQSDVSPLGAHGRFAVESYLDFHGNRFPRRFDANSYIRLVDAMSSHDVGRGRGGVEAALATITAPTLVLGIDSDRLYPIGDQERIARAVPTTLDGPGPVVLASAFGHDAFLIEREAVGRAIAPPAEPSERRAPGGAVRPTMGAGRDRMTIEEQRIGTMTAERASAVRASAAARRHRSPAPTGCGSRSSTTTGSSSKDSPPGSAPRGAAST